MKKIIIVTLCMVLIISGCIKEKDNNECKQPYTEICFFGYQGNHLFLQYHELIHRGRLKNISCFELAYTMPISICEGYINKTTQEYGCYGLIKEMVVPCQKGMFPLNVYKE